MCKTSVNKTASNDKANSQGFKYGIFRNNFMEKILESRGRSSCRHASILRVTRERAKYKPMRVHVYFPALLLNLKTPRCLPCFNIDFT